MTGTRRVSDVGRVWARRFLDFRASETRLHFIGVGIVVTAFLAHSALSHRSQVFGPAFTHGDRRGGTVALTFDDGPNDPYTTEVLDILKARGVKATFFVIGENAMQFPDTVRREVAEGMEIGNHTYNHGSVVRAKGRTIEWEIDETQATLRRIAGVEPKWFRPPHGFRDPRLFSRTRHNDLVVAEWSNMPRDWTCPGADAIVERTLEKLKPGDIILLHDGDSVYVGGDRSQTVAALPRIIDGIQARGLRCVTLSELAAGGGRGLKDYRRLGHDQEEPTSTHEPPP